MLEVLTHRHREVAPAGSGGLGLQGGLPATQRVPSGPTATPAAGVMADQGSLRHPTRELYPFQLSGRVTPVLRSTDRWTASCGLTGVPPVGSGRPARA